MTLWRHRDILLLWSGQTVSQVGTKVTVVAALYVVRRVVVLVG